jgi:hypothetical protein
MVAMMVNLSEKCCEQRCQVIVKALVEKGAAIDFKDASPVNNVHVTRSHCVCASGLPRQNTFARGPSRCCSSSCRFLIKRLPSQDIVLWRYCLWIGFIQSVVFMVIHGPMVQAAYYGHLNLVEYFVEKPGAWHQMDSKWHQKTSIHSACSIRMTSKMVEFFCGNPCLTRGEGRRMAGPMMDIVSAPKWWISQNHSQFSMPIYVNLYPAANIPKDSYMINMDQLYMLRCSASLQSQNTWRVLSKILRLSARSHALNVI